MANLRRFIRAGDLRHRVEYQTRTMSQGTSGESTPFFSTQNTRWARVEPFQGDEKTLAAQQVADVTHMVTLRWQGGERPKDQLLWGSRVFNIRRIVNVDELDKKLVLLCTEVVK